MGDISGVCLLWDVAHAFCDIFAVVNDITSRVDSEIEMEKILSLTIKQLFDKIEGSTSNPYYTRERNILRGLNMETVGDIMKKGEYDLLIRRNCGRASIRNIKKALSAVGLSLAWKV